MCMEYGYVQVCIRATNLLKKGHVLVLSINLWLRSLSPLHYILQITSNQRSRSRMKLQQFSGDHHHQEHLMDYDEAKKVIRRGVTLRRVYADARVAMPGNQTLKGKGGWNYISMELERRNKRSGVEDSIRIIMFLGSWSHTWGWSMSAVPQSEWRKTTYYATAPIMYFLNFTGFWEQQ